MEGLARPDARQMTDDERDELLAYPPRPTDDCLRLMTDDSLATSTPLVDSK